MRAGREQSESMDAKGSKMRAAAVNLESRAGTGLVRHGDREPVISLVSKYLNRIVSRCAGIPSVTEAQYTMLDHECHKKNFA